MVADPALDHLILVELDADHGFIATTVEELVAAALHVVVLVGARLSLQTVAEVGLILGLVALGQIDDDCLVIDHRPVANLARRVPLSALEHLDRVVRLQEQVQLRCGAWQREL